MPGILKQDFSVKNTEAFFNMLMDPAINLYVAVARDNAYPWTNDSLPPTPVDSIADESSFRSKIIGIKRVPATTSNLAIAAARYNWASGTEYFTLDQNAASPKKGANWFVFTSQNKVYQCISKSGAGVLSTVEPQTNSADVDTGDGYHWKFLYDLSTGQVTSILLNNWVPVNYNANAEYPGGTLSSAQQISGDLNANQTLGANHIIVQQTLADEGSAIPFTCSYRQVGLLINPTLSGGGLCTGINYAASAINTNSGLLAYLENRRPTNRQVGQSENITVILEF